MIRYCREGLIAQRHGVVKGEIDEVREMGTTEPSNCR
jgi:hypothetical protein